jgi:hypothetical protein
MKVECVPIHEFYRVTGLSPNLQRLYVEAGLLVAVRDERGQEYITAESADAFWSVAKREMERPARAPDMRPGRRPW